MRGSAVDRFEAVEEPTGTFAIFDTLTGVPVTVGETTFIGLECHEVEAALAMARSALGPGNWLLPATGNSCVERPVEALLRASRRRN